MERSLKFMQNWKRRPWNAESNSCKTGIDDQKRSKENSGEEGTTSTKKWGFQRKTEDPNEEVRISTKKKQPQRRRENFNEEG